MQHLYSFVIFLCCSSQFIMSNPRFLFLTRLVLIGLAILLLALWFISLLGFQFHLQNHQKWFHFVWIFQLKSQQYVYVCMYVYNILYTLLTVLFYARTCSITVRYTECSAAVGQLVAIKKLITVELVIF